MRKTLLDKINKEMPNGSTFVRYERCPDLDFINNTHRGSIRIFARKDDGQEYSFKIKIVVSGRERI